MGRAPCCDKANVKKGPWSPEEDAKLLEFMEKYGTGGNWISLPQKAGLKRCGKSCRLRWLNYLRPNIKHGEFSDDEDMIICNLYATIGSRWSIIASQLPGRTDNDIKNYWNTKLKKKLMNMVMAPNPNYQYETKPSSLFSPSLLHQNPLSLSSYFTPIEPPLPIFPIPNHQEIISPNNTTLITNNNYFSSLFQTPNYNYPSFKDGVYNFCGGGEPSCSSSNGSSSGCNVKIKQEEQMGVYRPNGLEESYQNMVMFGGNGGEVLDQISGGSGLEYDVEGIKDLSDDIISNEGIIKNNIEREMYCNYYY